MTLSRFATTLLLAGLAAEASVLVFSRVTYPVAGASLELPPDGGATLVRQLPGRRVVLRLDSPEASTLRVEIFSSSCEPLFDLVLNAPAKLEVQLPERGYYAVALTNLEASPARVLVEISSPPGLEHSALLRASLICAAGPITLAVSLLRRHVGPLRTRSDRSENPEQRARGTREVDHI